MTLRPALHSTPEPPIEITDLHLKEYVQELRRRIEVQYDQLEALSEQIKDLQRTEADLTDLIERLTLDLAMVRK
jgi:uncharacterized membrane protein